MKNRITIISLQTYGDYMLKSPFLHELYAANPDAEVVMVTNRKGGQVYPLIDSRLRLVVFDKSDSKAGMALRLLRIPRAETLYLVDHTRYSYLFSFFVRARRRVGWMQSVSRLYFGSDEGFRDRYAVSSMLSRVMGLLFDRKRLREPEGMWEGHVELALLPAARKYPRLAQYRSDYGFPPAPKKERRHIICIAFASWVARQLSQEVWVAAVNRLVEALPEHEIVFDAPPPLLAQFSGTGRVRPLARTDDLSDLFRLVSSADLVICSDSFLTHLASWYDVPSVSFFGPARPHRFGPTAPGSVVLYHPPPCSPCAQQHGSNPCRAGHTQCLSLREITAEEIGSAAEKALQGVGAVQNWSHP
jgi:ADP-heptose:LPS heptosyltransferase